MIKLYLGYNIIIYSVMKWLHIYCTRNNAWLFSNNISTEVILDFSFPQAILLLGWCNFFSKQFSFLACFFWIYLSNVLTNQINFLTITNHAVSFTMNRVSNKINLLSIIKTDLGFIYIRPDTFYKKTFYYLWRVSYSF